MIAFQRQQLCGVVNVGKCSAFLRLWVLLVLLLQRLPSTKAVATDRNNSIPNATATVANNTMLPVTSATSEGMIHRTSVESKVRLLHERNPNYMLLGVSGTLQDGFPLRSRLDYVDHDLYIPAIWVGKAVVRGYKAYLDIKKPNTVKGRSQQSVSDSYDPDSTQQQEMFESTHHPREYRATDPPTLPNAVVLATGCWHDANLYWIYAVPVQQMWHVLAGEPRYLAISADTGLIDLNSTMTDDSVRSLTYSYYRWQQQQQQQQHHVDNVAIDPSTSQEDPDTNETLPVLDMSVVSIPLVTGVWFDASTLVESPIVAWLDPNQNTRLTRYDVSLAMWAGIEDAQDLIPRFNENDNDLNEHEDDVSCKSSKSNDDGNKTFECISPIQSHEEQRYQSAWNQVYKAIRQVETTTWTTPWPKSCHDDRNTIDRVTRFGTGQQHLRIHQSISYHDLVNLLQ